MWSDRLQRHAQQLARKATPVLALLLIGLVYFLGVRSERTGFVREVLDPGLKRIAQPVLNAFRGSPPKLPLLRLVIDEALLDSLRSDAEQGPFPVIIERNGEQVNASARMAPAREAMDDDERPSWSISLAAGDSVLVMGSFELRPVQDAVSLQEWLLQAALTEIGNPALPYEFVDVRVNDGRGTLHTMRAEIDPALKRAWGLGGGTVFRFDDALLRNVRGALGPRNPAIAAVPQGEWQSAPLVEVPLGPIGAAPRPSRGDRAVRSLEAFRAGRAPTGNVFDLRTTARLFALSDLLGAQEACTWDRLWLVPDSTTGAITPVPMFGRALEPIRTLHVQQAAASFSAAIGPGFIDHLFHDERYFATYMAYLDTFSAEGWLEHLLTELAPKIQVHERIVSGAFPDAHFDLGAVHEDRKLIQQLLRPADLALAFSNPGPTGKQRPAAANVHALPLQVLGMVCGPDTILLHSGTILWPRPPGKPLEYLPLPLELEDVPCRLLLRMVGLTEVRSIPIRKWSTYAADETGADN